MSKLHFRSSEAFMDADPRAAEHAEIEILDYLEGTYSSLRHDERSGEEIAAYINGAWELPDGRRFSDWAIEVTS